MQHARIVLALLAIVLGTFGCEQKNPPQGGSSSPQQQQQPRQSPPPPSGNATASGQVSSPQEPAVSSGSDTVMPWSDMRRTCRYIIVDGSGSMDEKCSGEKKITAAKSALTTFISKLPPDDNIGLFVFDNRGTREVVPLGNGPENRAALQAGVNAISANGGTPLGESIDAGITALKAQAKKQFDVPELWLTIVTDGAASDENALERAVKRSRREGIPIQTIGFCIGERHSLRTSSVRYMTASDRASLESALEQTLGEIE